MNEKEKKEILECIAQLEDLLSRIESVILKNE